MPYESSGNHKNAMICTHCFNSISDQSLYCPFCGKKVSSISSNIERIQNNSRETLLKADKKLTRVLSFKRALYLIAIGIWILVFQVFFLMFRVHNVEVKKGNIDAYIGNEVDVRIENEPIEVTGEISLSTY